MNPINLAEAAGAVGVATLFAKAALATVYVRTKPFQSKVIAGFGGDFLRATTPGGTFKKPWERVAFTADQTLQVTDFPVNIKTKENNFIDVPIQIHYEISDPMKSARLPDEAKRKQVMQTLAQNVIRSHFAEEDLQEVYKSRNEIATAVKNELQSNMADYGLTIRDVMVENPRLPEDLQKAMQAVTISARNMEAARNNAESTKITTLAKAEGDQALMLAQAAGEKARLLAEAEGKGAIRVAEAEAEKKARLALGEGVAGEQTAIAKGFEDSIKSMTAAGISADRAMEYLMATNTAQYTKQNIATLAEGYKNIKNAVLFADAPNPGSLVSGSAALDGASSGRTALIKEIVTVVAALEAARPAPEAASISGKSAPKTGG